MNLNDKVAIVTGAADGIGLAASMAFAGAGAQVVMADVDEKKLMSSAVSVGGTPVKCDVCNQSHVDKVKEAATHLGPVEVVMANAGVAVGGRFEQIPTEEWQRLFDVNVHGVVRTINAFLPGMLERQSGHIVITGSSAGLFNSDGGNAPYAASKYALQGMAKALAAYCRPAGVVVHYLAPRLTNTGFPLSSVAWGRRGARVTSDRDIGDDYDAVEDVIKALIAGIDNDEFLISLTKDTSARLSRFAQSLSPFDD